MANLCENKFLINSDNEDTINILKDKLEKLFEDKLNGEVTAWDYAYIEGWFDSRWTFPDEIFSELFEGFDDIYFRCLSEEYGCGYVAMNIFEDGEWRDEQTFDL